MANDKDKAPEPMTPMVEMFSSLHEMYTAMKTSGFTSWEACRILGVYMAEMGTKQ